MIINEVGGGGLNLDPLSNPGGANQALSGYQYYNQNGDVITGNISTRSLSSPSISVNSSGLITASVSQNSGYVSSATKSATKQLTTQSGTTITPGTSQKTAVSSGRYTTGTVYVAGDSDLVGGNIRKGVNIFGVTGTYEGETKDLVRIEITNDSDTSVYVCYINSSDYLSYTDTYVGRHGKSDTIYAIRNTVVAIIGGGSAAARIEEWNSELEQVQDGHNSAAYYIPTNANNSAHIVIS